MPFVKLARVEEVQSGCAAYCSLDSGPIVIANYAGRLHAVSGICPHKWNSLDGAKLSGPYITCPYHQYQYDVRTGANHFPQSVYPKEVLGLEGQLRPLRTFSVEVRDGDVWVNINE